jgi:hypothetical protein
MALDARVPRKGIRAADEHLQARALEDIKRVAIKRALLVTKNVVPLLRRHLRK